MFADRIACPDEQNDSIHRAALPASNMLREDANRLAFRPAVLLKRIGHDALDRVAQPFELRLPFVGPGALLTSRSSSALLLISQSTILAACIIVNRNIIRSVA